MPVPDISGLPPFADFEMVVKKFNELVQKYNNLLVNMDSLNVISLTADHIDAGTLDANIVTIRSDLTNGYIQIDGTGLIVNNGLFNTFTVDINGNVTMTSALIQSALGYPKIMLNSANNLLLAYASETQFLNIEASSGAYGTTAMEFVNEQTGQSVAMFISGVANQFLMSSNRTIQISALPSGDVRINGSNVIINGVTTSGVVYVSATPGGSADMPISFVNGLRTL